MSEWPELTKQAIENVDGTPDAEYPLRILRAYRQNCDVRWATSTNGECDNPLFALMNEHCKQRAKILDNAISILENAAIMRITGGGIK